MNPPPTAVSVTDHAFLRCRERVLFFNGMTDQEITRLVASAMPSAVALAPAAHGRRLVAIKIAATQTIYVIIKIHQTFSQVITCLSADIAEDYIRKFNGTIQRSVSNYGRGYTGKKLPRRPRRRRRRDGYLDEESDD